MYWVIIPLIVCVMFPKLILGILGLVFYNFFTKTKNRITEDG